MRNITPIEHPAVDWSDTIKGKGGTKVAVICPRCHERRYASAGGTTARIRGGSFTGYCYKDRLIQHKRIDSPDRPPHPCVDWDDIVLQDAGRQRQTLVHITCPTCGQGRYMLPNRIAYNIRKGTFTGECLACTGRTKKREWVQLGPGRRIEPGKGYIRISLDAIAPADLPIYHALRGGATYVMEHRFVMSRLLGRALRQNELVDHMDGNKLNNAPDNLRLYIRGSNMPGETSGYGTYYHEWQLALAEIERLKTTLAQH